MRMQFDPNELTKVAFAAVTALVAAVWGFLRADIGRANGGVDKCLAEIRTLYDNAEADRAKTRDLIDARADKLTATMNENQHEVMKTLSELRPRNGGD